MALNVGILGLGAYLPSEIRTNDWWPAEVVERWQVAQRAAPRPGVEGLTELARRVIEALGKQARDPFQGIVRRPVMPSSMRAVDMEAAAAESALSHASIDRSRIGLLLVHTAVPEYLLSNPASELHERLGLPSSCLALQVDAAAYSFLGQLELARHAIASGSVTHALLVQSSAASRLLDPEDQASVWFGDAATAVVVGPTSSQGILASVHRTNGKYPRALVATARAGTWYEAARPVLHQADPAAARKVFVDTVDYCAEVVGEALGKCGVAASEIDFFAVHQGTPWLRELTQQAVGLTKARSHDLFASTGYLFAASIPLVLHEAQRAGTLRSDDLVLMFGGGTGVTYGSTVLRWVI